MNNRKDFSYTRSLDQTFWALFYRSIKNNMLKCINSLSNRTLFDITHSDQNKQNILNSYPAGSQF